MRRQIGCVIVDANNRVVATGYNGPAAGYPGSCETACSRARHEDAKLSWDYANCISIHAEANALMFCDRRDREGGTIYVEEMPCWDCAKLIANSGLKRVVVYTLENQEHRPVSASSDYMERSGVRVEVYAAAG